MEFLGKIGIDLNMVAAQAVNFLILVFILRWALYQPMLTVFKKRKEATEKLEKDVVEIEKKKKEAEAAYRAKLLDGEGRANEIISQAKKTVDAFSDASLVKNREYLDQMLRETKSRIDGAKSELAKLNHDAVRDAAFVLAAQFLSSTMQRELHEKLVKTAMHNFSELGSREEDIGFKGNVAIQTAYALQASDKNRLQHLLQKKFGKKLSLEMDVEAGLRAGIIIRWGGYELDGSLRTALAVYADKC